MMWATTRLKYRTAAIGRLASNDKLKLVEHSYAKAVPPNTFL